MVARFHSGHSSNIFSANFLQNTNHIVSCAADGLVKFHDITAAMPINDGFHPTSTWNNPNPTPPFKCHGDSIAFKVEPSLTSPFVFYSCASDGTVNRYDLRTETSCNCNGCSKHTIIDINIGAGFDSCKTEHVLANPTSHEAPRPRASSYVLRQFFRTDDWDAAFGIADIALNPANEFHLATASDDDFLRIWDLRFVNPSAGSTRERGQMYHFSPFGQGRLHKMTSVCFDPSGSGDVLVSYARDHIYLIRPSLSGGVTSGDDVVNVYKGAKNERTLIKESNFFPLSASFIAAGSDSGHVFLWDRKTAKVIGKVKADGNVVNCVQADPAGRPRIAVSGIDDTIKLLEPGGEEFVQGDGDEVWDEDEDEDGVVVIPSQLLLQLLESLENEWDE